MSKKIYPLLMKDINDISYNVLENGFLTGDVSWSYFNMVSPYNRMYFFIGGDVTICNETENVQLAPGYVYLIPANSTYNYQCNTTMEKFYLHFELHILPGLEAFNGLDKILSMPYDPIVLELMRVYASDRSLCGLVHLKALLLEYAAKFLTQAMSMPTFSMNYTGYYNQKDAIAYINENLNAQLKIEEIAQAVQVSPHVLTRTFKADIGVGVKRYIEMQILKQSKHMLLYQSKTICEIADAFSFCDAYYFSRFFKKFEHIPPSEYRKRMR